MRKKQSRENAYCQETVRYRIIKLNEKAFSDLGAGFVMKTIFFVTSLLLV